MKRNLRCCFICVNALLAIYDFNEIQLNKESLSKRKLGVWKYREFLPQIDERNIISIGEGGTFLHKCEKLAEKLGLKLLYVKNETTNPTGSFLDGRATVEISWAKNNRSKFNFLRKLFQETLLSR